MLKTKCFIIGGIILSSSLQAEVSEPVKETGNKPVNLVMDEEMRNILHRIAEEERNKPERPILAKEKQLKEKQLAKPARTQEEIDLEIKLLEIKEQEELKRKVKMHEDEIQGLKKQLKEIEYTLDRIMNGPILTPPSLPHSLRW